MFSKLKPKSEFSRNVLTLMTGTTIAQAVPIAISPILTRIYTPEDFGVFALYMAIAAIISVIATGRYEMAIMLPKKDESAVNIVVLSVIISFFVSFITFLMVYIFNSQITNLLGNQEISNWLYFIPITVLLTGIYQSFNYWSNRKKEYKRLAISRVVQSGTTATSNLSMGYSGFGSIGLILGGVIGQSIATSVLGRLIYKEDKNIFKRVTKLKVLAVAKRYIKFPKFLILAHGMNALSGQSPILLLSSLFNVSVVGFYMIVQRVVGLPMSIIASAISDVFRQKASVEYINNGNCKDIFKSTFKKLLLIAIIPFIFFYIYAPELFAFVFGKEWKVAGEYAQILTPMFFLQFATSPLSSMFMIAEKQQLDLYWQIFLLIITVLAILTGKYLYDNIESTLLLFSLGYSTAYIINIFMTYKFAKGNL